MLPETADFVIVGAGVMGTSTAFHLASRGAGHVVLLEKDAIGSGSTGRTGGIIRQHYSNEVTARMAKRSLEVFQNFSKIVGGDAGFTETGALFIVGERDRKGLAANVALQQSVGISTRVVDVETMRELAPYLDLSDDVVAAYEPEAGYADGTGTATGFAQAAQRHGAEVHQNVAVTDIIVEGDRVAGVRTTAGDIQARRVAVTAGPWGGRLLSRIGIDFPLEVSRHQVASVRRPEGVADPHHPVVGDFLHGYYMRSETGQLTLIGSIEAEEAQNIVAPDDYKLGTDRGFVEEYIERASRRFPALMDGEIMEGWSGLYTVTPDWHPIIDAVTGIEGLFCALGFSGHGFKLGPVVGEMVADLVAGEQQCPIDSSIFNARRFEEGRLVRGQYEYSIIG
ncbi:MAG: NAD(P)/FAD-dependent oxidoreductase [Anaerolineae bacterium]